MSRSLLLGILLLGTSFLTGCTLTVTKDGDGSGTVSGPGINCGADCEENYPDNTQVVISASAARGSLFSGWSGSGAENCGRSAVCLLSMNQSRLITATFSKDPNFCEGYLPPRITSRPKDFSGRSELRWEIEGGCISDRSWGIWNSTRRQVDFMGSYCSVWGGGKRVLHKVSIAHQGFVGQLGADFSAEAPRSCTFSDAAIASLPSGTYTMVTGKQHFRSWRGFPFGRYVSVVGASPVATDNFVLSRTVKVFLEPTPPEGGSIASSTHKVQCEEVSAQSSGCWIEVQTGDRVDLQSTAREGWAANGWETTENLQPDNCSGNTCTLRPLQSGTARALFKRQLFQLSVTNGDGGVVSSRPDGIDCGAVCQASFESGETVTLEAFPADNFRFAGWQGDCQGSLMICTVNMNSNKSVRATWEPLLEPTITGPEVVFGPDEPLWSVYAGGGGDIVCSIEEVDLYTAGSQDEGDDPLETTRRYSGVPCSGSRAVERFQTPLDWPGRKLDESEQFNSSGEPGDVEDTTPGGSPVEQNGKTLALPDGEYQVAVEQTLYMDLPPYGDPKCDPAQSIGCPGEAGEESFDPSNGLVGGTKTIYLDRLPPDPIRIQIPDGGSDEGVQEVGNEAPYQWYFTWGRDLTQKGQLEQDGSQQAGVRCEIRRVTRNEDGSTSIGDPLLWTDWGGCTDGAASTPTYSTTPRIWQGSGIDDTSDLEEGRYRIYFYQRDRASSPGERGYPGINDNHIRETVFPFQRVDLFSSAEPSQDRLRFSARWQNIFVASTRPPSGREGAIGEAWHPLRCNAPGVGLLIDCLDSLPEGPDGEPTKIEGDTPEESEANFLELDPEDLWKRSFLVQEGDALGTYRAQGFVRLATPGRFETNNQDRRTLHARLTVDSVKKEDGAWEGADPFCNEALPVGAVDIVGIASATSDCTVFPVEEANVFVRPEVEGIIVDENQLPPGPVEIMPRDEYEVQNAITGNSEIHICQPGVPRSQDVDVWDGENGTFWGSASGDAKAQRQAEVLGPSPDRDCEGYLLVWRWKDQVRNAVCVADSGPTPLCAGESNIIAPAGGGLVFSGDPSFCQAGVPSESALRPPTLEEMTSPVFRALRERVGSYRMGGADLPYRSGSDTIWQSQGYRGDPYLLDSAPWSERGRVSCGGGRYLDPKYGEWSLWLPGGAKPSLFVEDQKPALQAFAGPGFGSGLFSLPLASDLDGLGGTIDEGMIVDFKLQPPPTSTSGGPNGYYWFLDSRYYGYHLQNWAYSTDLDAQTRDIEVLMPRSSR